MVVNALTSNLGRGYQNYVVPCLPVDERAAIRNAVRDRHSTRRLKNRYCVSMPHSSSPPTKFVPVAYLFCHFFGLGQADRKSSARRNTGRDLYGLLPWSLGLCLLVICVIADEYFACRCVFVRGTAHRGIDCLDLARRSSNALDHCWRISGAVWCRGGQYVWLRQPAASQYGLYSWSTTFLSVSQVAPYLFNVDWRVPVYGGL